jgi:hypothetical protein
LISSKAASKFRHNAADKISEMLDRFEQRLAVHNPRLTTRYVEAEIHLLIHFSVDAIDEKFVTNLKRAEVIGWPTAPLKSAMCFLARSILA